MPWPEQTLRWSGIGLAGVSWLSAAMFGCYILAFYIAAAWQGHFSGWNGNLPALYAPGHPLSLLAMGGHMAMGGVLLLLGPLQLIGAVRRRWPAFHRWIGRLYVAAAGIAGAGGLIFIAARGTIGGIVMDIGFGLYGALMVWAAWQTYGLARARHLVRHRAWAIRLFALTTGSWLYRMDYGFWEILANGIGHTHDFRGPFDQVMVFFFYIPNLLVAELFIRARVRPRPGALSLSAAALLAACTLFVGVGSYYFTLYYWGPAILHGLEGHPGT